jgi:hypothetical protein
VVISHSTDEFAPDRTHAASAAATERGATWLPRPKDEIARISIGGRRLRAIDAGRRPAPPGDWRLQPATYQF